MIRVLSKVYGAAIVTNTAVMTPNLGTPAGGIIKKALTNSISITWNLM